MKKRLLTVLCLCSLYFYQPAFSLACSFGYIPPLGYEVEEGVVIYHDGQGNSQNSKGTLVEGANPQNIHFYGEYYAIDDRHVYYKGTALPNADAKSAQYLGGYDHFDDPGYRRFTSDGYLKDNKQVWFNGQPMTVADVESFTVLDEPADSNGIQRRNSLGYARDKEHAYLNGVIIPADPNTMQLLPYHYYLDSKHIYFATQPLAGALPDSFEQKGEYLLSNGKVFVGIQLTPFDAATFEILQSFESIANSCEIPVRLGNLIKDAKGVYHVNITYKNKPLPVKKPANFKILNNEMAEDGQQLYLFYAFGWSEPFTFIPLELTPNKTYIETYQIDGTTRHSFYKDDRNMYLWYKLQAPEQSREKKVDTRSTTLYAKLNKSLLFRDKQKFYLVSSNAGAELDILSKGAELACFFESGVCVLQGNRLYLIPGASSETLEISIHNPKQLRCAKEDFSIDDLKVYEGECFDRQYIYYEDETESLPEGFYEKALSHTFSKQEIEQRRKDSIEKVEITKEPLTKDF